MGVRRGGQIQDVLRKLKLQGVGADWRWSSKHLPFSYFTQPKTPLIIKCTIDLFSTKEKQKQKTLAISTAFYDTAPCRKATLLCIISETELTLLLGSALPSLGWVNYLVCGGLVRKCGIWLFRP